MEETVADGAYGGGPTRRAFAEEERVLTAKVPASSNGDCFPKSEFVIDLEKREVRCPEGQVGGGRWGWTPGVCRRRLRGLRLALAMRARKRAAQY